MYSPKISEDLVPVLYRAARSKKMPMTRLVNGIIRQALASQGLLQNSTGDSKIVVSMEGSEPHKAVA